MLKDYRKKGEEVHSDLMQLTTNETKDPVAQRFLALAKDAAVTNIPLNEGAFTRAHRRKLLGNPPNSDKLHTIGDEVIWELLLEHITEYPILVTRDGDFQDCESVLRSEYKARVGRKLLPVAKN